MAWRLANANRPGQQAAGMGRARALYFYSLVYLALIFTAIVVDSVVKV